MGKERAFAPPFLLTGLLIASHRVLPHRPMLAVSARREAYSWYQGSQTDLLLPVLVRRSIGVIAPIQSYNWYHWYQQGDGPSAGRRGAPFPNPAEGLWLASPFQTVADSFQPRLQLRLTE